MNIPSSDLSSDPVVVEPVGVLGVGVEGRATINYLLSCGITRIEALDCNPVEGLPADITCVFGPDYADNLARFGTIFKSPGIRPDLPELEKARDAGVTITSALSHFMEICPARVFGITGTLGKGTAATILAEALKAAGCRVHLGGNIGTSPLDFVADVKPEDCVVLEISSFQAMDISQSPPIAGILRTTSEHLDWHVSTEEYRLAKAHLLHRQSTDDVVVYCADAEGSVEIASRSAGRRVGYSLHRKLEEGLHADGDQLILRLDGVQTVLPFSISNMRMAGRFNLENIAAAVLMAVLFGADPGPVCRAAQCFPGLPHRLEYCAAGGGIRFYNDSYATRPEAAIAAVGAFAEPLALILGGSEKNADFSQLTAALRAASNLRQVVLIGATASRLETALTADGQPAFHLTRADSLRSAMEIGVRTLSDGGVLLMSPACASFGMFKNYKDRGEQFRQLAMEWTAAETIS